MPTSLVSSLAASWAALLATYGPQRVQIAGQVLVQLVFFWLPAALYLCLDWVAPDFSQRHKLQPAPKQPTAADIRHCAVIVLRNNVVSMSMALALAVTAGDANPDPSPVGIRCVAQLPSAVEVARDLLLCCVIREVMFYYAHRLLHQPRWYKTIHKTHHKFIAPVGLAAQYAHPVEHIVANVLPVGLPPILVNAHVLTNFAFVAIMLLETCTVHSGYDFFDGAAKMHDLHHEKFNLNYGVFGWMDWLHGTDKLKSKRKQAE